MNSNSFGRNTNLKKKKIPIWVWILIAAVVFAISAPFIRKVFDVMRGNVTDKEAGDDGKGDSVGAEGEGEGGIKYTLLDDGTYAAVGVVDYSITKIVVPSKYNGKAVTEISSGAFEDCKALEIVKIEDGIRLIGENAFKGCDALAKVTLPESVRTIRSGAFMGCSSLTGIKLPSAITAIYEHTFDGCKKILEITLPPKVVIIGENAFKDCIGLEVLRLPAAVRRIGNNIFYGHTEHFYIEFEGTNEAWNEIKKSEFWDWPNNYELLFGASVPPTIDIEDIPEPLPPSSYDTEQGVTPDTEPNPDLMGSEGLRYIYTQGGWAILGKGSCLDEVVIIPSKCGGSPVVEIADMAFYTDATTSKVIFTGGVKVIRQKAFMYCYLLKEVVLSEGITTLEARAFSNCVLLQTVTIPRSVTYIGSAAFYGCEALTTINYGGTRAEFNAIEKEDNWRTITGDFIIHCTDGDLLK